MEDGKFGERGGIRKGEENGEKSERIGGSELRKDWGVREKRENKREKIL